MTATRIFWRSTIFGLTLIGVVLGLLGPFGSYLNGGATTRIAYWVASMWLGIATYGVGFVIVQRLVPQGTRWAWPALALSTLIASVPQAIITRAAVFQLWPKLTQQGLTLWVWYLQVAMIGLVSVLGGTLISQNLRKRAAPHAKPAPPTLTGTIIALQMEDHYVRVHTERGSNLILMTLSEAMEQVSNTEGLRTHRSWWVARNAVAAVEGKPRAMNLRLTNGIIAPVARNAVAQLRAAGWLDPA